ncbi:ABC transporter ATP-binding protein [Vibrio hannami]|uniref:ABC transporter ATP-binding protein n=1 Tax=Vibrio hannami TaxID=2717094 RepID=UPI00240F06D2|nr:ABC transporter ATP-binding protein [Vibrio hannami]MDG3085107.1 ABC transporter ATP-binding protein [Vibrio hannami]
MDSTQDAGLKQDAFIEVRSLTRSFGKSRAVDNMSFTLQRGEICAFLGPNGAGKTTTIKMLTGLLEPDSGQIFYDNLENRSDRHELRRLIGVVPQHNNIDRELTPAENLRVHGLLYKMRGKALEQAIEESLEFAGLQEHKQKPSGKLSGGMKRKLVIARALMHKPKILFLDEPTVGLDPHSRRKMWSFLNKINQEHKCTIFLTTHYIEEAERLSERVIFIDSGKIVTEGTAETLKQQLGQCVLDIETEELKQEFFDDREQALERLSQITHAPVSIRETTLEDVFLHLTGKRLAKNA